MITWNHCMGQSTEVRKSKKKPQRWLKRPLRRHIEELAKIISHHIDVSDCQISITNVITKAETSYLVQPKRVKKIC